jgi:SAM-dependent methyltransferase
MSTSKTLDASYWQSRYLEGQTGWDLGAPSTPLKEFIDQLTDKDLRILIPGAGNSYEAEYLFTKGFNNVFVVDFAAAPLAAFANRVPGFPESQLIQKDFFQLEGQFDLILEQTFFCAINPSLRSGYARHMHHLLKPGGTLAGLLFDCEMEKEGPPFGGNRAEYLAYFSPLFDLKRFESAQNSIAPRAGRELFMECVAKLL